MYSTIHAVCGQQKKGKTELKATCDLYLKKKKNYIYFLVKRAGRHFGFFKRAGRHEKGAGRRALQKKSRQNTASDHYCIETVAPSGVHNCIDIVVPSSDQCCTGTVPPSSDHYGTIKVAPPSPKVWGRP